MRWAPYSLRLRYAAQRRTYLNLTDETSKSTGSNPPRGSKVTIQDLVAKKRNKVPIVFVTAHDYASARFIEQSQKVDVTLVGDSLAMVACGYDSTQDLHLDEMLYHCAAVRRGTPSTLRISDVPYSSVSDEETASQAAQRLVKDGGMDAVKIEGGAESLPIFKAVLNAGVPVIAHIGLQPQRATGVMTAPAQSNAEDACKIIDDALAAESAGCFALLLECIPASLARIITELVSIPTIGIGSGVHCDGQVLVQLDLLGVRTLPRTPRFVKTYEDFESRAVDALDHYATDVLERTFPSEGMYYKMKKETLARAKEYSKKRATLSTDDKQ